MGWNSPVAIVNTAARPAIFERQSAGNDTGTFTLGPGKTVSERVISLTYETLVLRNSSGDFTNHMISMDDLDGDLYEKIEVTYDTNHDFRLVKHPRRTWTQKIADLNPFKSRSAGGPLPT